MRARLHGTLHGLPRGASERYLSLNLVSDTLRDERGLKLRLPNLIDVDPHALARHVLEFLAQLLNALSAASNDDAGASSVDQGAHLARLALKLDPRHRSVSVLVDDMITNPQVFQEIRAVLLRAVGEPMRLPIADVAEAEPERVNLVTHLTVLLVIHDDCQITVQSVMLAGLSPGARLEAPQRLRRPDVHAHDAQHAWVEIKVVLGVRCGGTHHLGDVLCPRAGHELQLCQRVIHVHARQHLRQYVQLTHG